MVAALWSRDTATGTVHVVASDRDDGDFHLDAVPPDELDRRRRRLVDLPWTMLDERHGTHVVTVREPGGEDRQVGDAAVTALDGAVLGVWVGDCAPIVVVDDAGTFAVVHAGWRGLTAGVIDVAIDAMHPSGRTTAVLGPCIGPCCYEFGADDLAGLAAAVGRPVAELTGCTTWGTPSLDVPRAVASVLGRRGIAVEVVGPCTGCSDRYFSHRTRRDPARHVVAAWKDARSPARAADPDGAGR